MVKKVLLGGVMGVLGLAVIGEPGRLMLGVLPNDLVVGALGITWLLHKFLIKRVWPTNPLWLPFWAFIAIAGLSLLNGTRFLTTQETITSGTYLLRFIAYGLLIFITHDLSQNSRYHALITRGLIATATLLALIGFLQLYFVPDFRPFEQYGWDPHVGRLLSTWFDPNFIGGLFAFVLCLMTPPILKNKKGRTWLILSGLLILIALLLTYSRSSYVAFLGGMFIIGLMRSRKLLLTIAIACVLLISLSPRAHERVTTLYHTGKALLGISAELPDATARLRLESWSHAWDIIEDHPWLGVGYNAYGPTQIRYGFIKSLDEHDATGSDSTLLTIWATTGLMGLMAYLWFLSAILWAALQNRTNSLTMGLFAGIIALLIHSVFINSLLFTPLLIFVYMASGLARVSPYAPLKTPGRTKTP